MRSGLAGRQLGGSRVCGAMAQRQRHARGEGLTQGLGGTEGTRGAHGEHGAHVRDLGGVEAAERLVELYRPLPSRREGIRMRCQTRCGPGGGRAWSGAGASGAQSGAV